MPYKIKEKICENCGSLFFTRNNKTCSKKCAYELNVKTKNKKGISSLGKTFEEMYGEKKAKELKEKISIHSTGNSNPMSLVSISIRNGCSILEAKEKTPAKNRVGILHPMFGKKHSIETIKKIQKHSEFSSCRQVVQGYLDGIYFQGGWELFYIVKCINENIPIKRYDLDPIKYFCGDREYLFFPDFIINNNYIVEIKGTYRYTDKNLAKKKVSKKIKNFLFLTLDDINFPNLGNKYIIECKKIFKDRLIIKSIPKKRSKYLIELEKLLNE